MDINLNFLKFHYFYKDKRLHNLSIKKWESYFQKIILDHNYSLLNIMIIINNCHSEQEFANRLLKFHILDNNHKDILLNKIIKKCHPNLYNQMEQFFSDDNYFKDLKFYQCKIHDKERLIFTIHKSNINNKSSFLPLILDLNHLIYKSNNKNFDNLNLNGLYEWDLKHEQEKIKIHLIHLINSMNNIKN